MLRLTFPTGDLIIDHRSALAPVQSLHCLDSEDEVRRLLLMAITTPSALDALRRFFARWNSEAWRVTVIKDRTLIERVARMTVNGPLAAFAVYRKPMLNTDEVTSKLGAVDLAQRMRAPGPPEHASHEAVEPPAATAAPLAAAAPAAAFVSPAALVEAAVTAARLNFTTLPVEQRFNEVLRLTPPHLPSALRGAFNRLLSSDMRVTTVGVLTVWGGSHDLGIDFITESLLSMTRIALRGSNMIDAAETLHEVIEYTLEAREERDLDYAAELLADVIWSLGVDTFIAMIAHGATRLVSSAAPGKPPDGPAPQKAAPVDRIESRTSAPQEDPSFPQACLIKAKNSNAAFVKN